MLATKIFHERKNIIPIIGENSFFYYSSDGNKIPLQTFLVDKIIERSKYKHPEDLPIDQMKSKGYHGLSLCRQLCFNDVRGFLKSYISVIQEYKERIHLDETVKEFLQRYKFHLIITTCCFDFIESDLSDSELKYKSKVYVAANGANNKEELNDNAYTVYHIFGKSDHPSMKWAWDEESLMNILHCHHNDDYAPIGLRKYIFPNQNSSAVLKSLLVLYSNLPDWLFRFFLYPLAYNENWSDGYGYYLNSKTKVESSLRNFIEKVIYYDIEEDNIDEVLTRAIEAYPQNIPCKYERIEHGKKWDIFMSYSTKDKPIAIEIKEKLEYKYGLKIWLDVSGGIEDGHYPLRMKYGIENSAYFMPLITRSYKEKLSNIGYDITMPMEEILREDGRSYVQKEAWAAAKQWEIIKQETPQRDVYLLPILFPESGVSYDNILAMQGLGQLPGNLFKEQHIIPYDDSLFEKDWWSRYKTIENNLTL